MEIVTLERYVDIIGTQTATAKELGVGYTRLNNWLCRTPGEYYIVMTPTGEPEKLVREVKVPGI